MFGTETLLPCLLPGNPIVELEPQADRATYFVAVAECVANEGDLDTWRVNKAIDRRAFSLAIRYALAASGEARERLIVLIEAQRAGRQSELRDRLRFGPEYIATLDQDSQVASIKSTLEELVASEIENGDLDTADELLTEAFKDCERQEASQNFARKKAIEAIKEVITRALEQLAQKRSTASDLAQLAATAVLHVGAGTEVLRTYSEALEQALAGSPVDRTLLRTTG